MMTESAEGDAAIAGGNSNEGDAAIAGGNSNEGTPPTPLFLFFTCVTSGRCFLRHKILDVSVHCWPYADNAPVFYRRMEHNDPRKESRKTQSKKSAKNSNPDQSGHRQTPQPVCVFEELLQWIDQTVKDASTALGLDLYPVLIAHDGETFQFLFLFRMLECYGIAMETLAAHNVHFADPVPVLRQYKDVKHAWLVDSRSLSLGSLLNDWFPATFDESDLMNSRQKGALFMKLYTQCPLYWLLYRIPMYDAGEWIEFYEGRKHYLNDKWELYERVPSSIGSIQRKMTIQNLLKHGYSWQGLLDLYKTCESPQHFKQELRDLDIKSGAAMRITLAITALKLPQDGSREYKVRIRSNMAYAKYYHLTNARGRHFILRVANVLPPCFTVACLGDDRWRVPENLQQIGLPGTWDAAMGHAWRDVGEGGHNAGRAGPPGPEASLGPDGICRGDETHHDIVARLLAVTFGDSDEEDDQWPDTSSPNGVALDDGQLPECFFRKEAPAHVPTTLVTGVKATNPFLSPSIEWVAVETSDKTPDPAASEKCQDVCSSGSSSDRPNSAVSSSTDRATSASWRCAASTDHKSSRSRKSNKIFHSRTGNSNWTNQRESARSGCGTSASQDRHSENRCSSTSTNGYKPSPGSGHSQPANQTPASGSGHPYSANHSPPAVPSTSSSGPFSDQGAVPRQRRCIPPRFQSKKKKEKTERKPTR